MYIIFGDNFMKKKNITLFGAFVATLGVLPVMTGCNKGSGEQIDPTRTTIFVNNFCRGFGGEWLNEYKKDFEALHINDSYEEGKKGVQVFISNARGPAEGFLDSILTGRDEIFFTEQTDYFTLLTSTGGVVRDISDTVTETIKGETTSILDKMTEGQKDYLNVDGKYYAVPHYSGYIGLTYDKDLFDKKDLYFNKDRGEGSTRLEDKFIIDRDEEKSVGPDGVAGTYDDGLPVTYAEFLDLCQYMQKTMHITPMTITGQSADYLNILINNFVINDLGLEQSNLIYSANGTVKDVIEIDAEGNITDQKDIEITPATGYYNYKTKARYEALKLYEQLNSKNENTKKVRYTLEKMDSTAYSVGLAQTDFLSSNIPGATSKGFQPIGMIGEGTWWVNEASATFDELSQIYGEQWSAKNRNLCFMPLPTSTDEGGHKNVLFDHLSSLCFMKKNVAEWKYPLLKEFIQFCNSDVNLVKFSTITNSTKALQYTIPETELAKMTPFGRSVYEVQKNSDIVYPYNSSKFYRNNTTFFKNANQYYSILGGLENQYIIHAFKQQKYSAAEYFRGMSAYYTADWSKRVL